MVYNNLSAVKADMPREQVIRHPGIDGITEGSTGGSIQMRLKLQK